LSPELQLLALKGIGIRFGLRYVSELTAPTLYTKRKAIAADVLLPRPVTTNSSRFYVVIRTFSVSRDESTAICWCGKTNKTLQSD